MTYIFDNEIVYSQEDGKLSLLSKPEEEPVILTPVLNRILLLLVTRQGELITKEDFFTYVWDNYGKSGSTNTLVQYISALRRLIELNLTKDFIITVPKKGYILNTEVSIIKVDDCLPASFSKETDKDTASADGIDDKKNLIKNIKTLTIKNKYLRIVYMIIFFLISSSVAYHSLPSSMKGDPSLTFLTKLRSCEVLTNDYINGESTKLLFQSYIKAFDLDCNSNDVFYFMRITHISNSSTPSQYIISKCTDNGHKFRSCSSFTREEPQ